MKKIYLLLLFLFLGFFTNVAMSQPNKKFTFSGKVLSADDNLPTFDENYSKEIVVLRIKTPGEILFGGFLTVLRCR